MGLIADIKAAILWNPQQNYIDLLLQQAQSEVRREIREEQAIKRAMVHNGVHVDGAQYDLVRRA